MGMYGILSALSPEHRATMERDPELLGEAIVARHGAVPGLLDLDESWRALDVLLDEGDDALLGDAILARSGRSFGPSLSYGRSKLLEPARVAAIARALAALPEEFVEHTYRALEGHDVHGGYGSNPWTGGDELEAYAEELAAFDDVDDEAEERAGRLEQVRTFYRDAAERGDAVIAVVV